MRPSILDEPLISFGRETCGDLAAAFRREWLVTNGIGGYASGALNGVSSRSYHGLLVAALEPPVGRIVLVGASAEQATYRGRRSYIGSNEYADGVFAPDGFRNLAEFRLEGTLPVWTYALADALIERRVWMVHGKNTTYVSYKMIRGTDSVELDITPLVTYRDHHVLTSGQGWQMQVERQPHGALDKAFDGATPLRMLTDTGEYRLGGRWYWNFRYRAETERGLNDHGDLYAPGSFNRRLVPGETLTLIYSVESDVDMDAASTLQSEQQRQRDLLITAGVTDADPISQQLVLAADQFIVERGVPNETGEPIRSATIGKSIIAGYHWFADWGRDTMISLPGLTLSTGRYNDAESILRTYAGLVEDGLLPNNFPERLDTAPNRNTADATLWFVHAVDTYRTATGDDKLVSELLPVIEMIVEAHINGTHYGIGVDAVDDLLRAGEPGVQLTWMDAKVDDWVVTPRIGKPVEINALWYNALRFLAAEYARRNDARAAGYETRAERMRANFLARFVHPDRNWLADVVDGPNGDDWSLRPNQIFALSLPYPLVEGGLAATVLEIVGQALLTTYGLRSLARDDRAYIGTYTGDRVKRDGAYHQGTVWAWLLGPYVESHWKVMGDREAALAMLRPFVHHLRDAGLGSISEIFDGDPPNHPRGAVAQAWSVAEILRVWRLLNSK